MRLCSRKRTTTDRGDNQRARAARRVRTMPTSSAYFSRQRRNCQYDWPVCSLQACSDCPLACQTAIVPRRRCSSCSDYVNFEVKTESSASPMPATEQRLENIEKFIGRLWKFEQFRGDREE